MNRFLVIAWVLVILGLAAVVGQSLGLYDVPLLREVRLPLPAVFQRQASPAGGPPRDSRVAARSQARAWPRPCGPRWGLAPRR